MSTLGTRRRLAGVALAPLLAAVWLTPVSPDAVAAPRPAQAPVCPSDGGADFDGNGGGTDLVIGVPGEDIGSVADAGAVEVRYSCGATADQGLRLASVHAGDRFGAAVAAGPINGDAYTDLAVGVPGFDVNGHKNAGAVACFYGSSTGLHFEKLITQATSGVPGAVQSGAHFGATLAFSRFDPGNASVLRIGEPLKNVGSAVDAGGVVDLVVGSGSTTHVATREITLASSGVPGSPGAHDQLGAALYETFVIGLPGRTVNGHAGAGAILRTTLSGNTLVTQNSTGVPGTSEAGDHFGAALAGRWIGVPGESVGNVAGAGAVVRPSLDPDERVTLTQGSPHIPGTVEAGDHFGASLAELGDVYDETEWSPRQLFIGSPGEDLGSIADVGRVVVVGEMSSEDDPFVLTGLYGELSAPLNTAGAEFGAALGRGGLHTLVVGAPGGDGGSATVFTAPETFAIAPARTETLTQTEGTPEAGDGYGSALVEAPN